MARSNNPTTLNIEVNGKGPGYPLSSTVVQNAKDLATLSGDNTFAGVNMFNDLTDFASITGGLAIFSNTIRANGSYVPPMYNLDGSEAAATAHIARGTVTAVGASTVVTFGASASFNDLSYVWLIIDQTTLTQAVVTARTVTSITFTSTAGHVYSVWASGI